ncbi:homeobox expressed in ES cells 1 [Labeo rohita]|uniref:Homeobox expressed in ES cells 1 n=1 Tax=Labeo rohita TaxID=84645 RepID=A0A498LPV7_LABRO|nr:homeobox expressed in ES cells 1 [Labeo rohita]
MASVTVSAHQNGPMPRQSAFTIDSILGLDRPDQRTVLSAPYRPWTDLVPEQKSQAEAFTQRISVSNGEKRPQ